MNFNASSNKESVFANNELPRFKGAPAVLPPPQMFGMGSSNMGKLPPPMGLSFNAPSKPSGLDAPFGMQIEPKSQDYPSIRPFAQTNNIEFPVFDQVPKRAFGLVCDHEPLMMLNKLERMLEFEDGIDYHRADDELNVIRGRYFGEFNNAEFEIRIFSWQGSEGNSYTEFNRFCGDGWVFSRFVEQIMMKFGGNEPQEQPAFPMMASPYDEADLAALLADVEESYQEIAEQAAAELAIQTRNESGRQMCDRIEAFCPRVLNILGSSTNCAIVRSCLIMLTNMSEIDGLTKRILGQQMQVVQNVCNKWGEAQSMCDGLFTIPSSQEVQRQAAKLLMAF